MRKGKKLLALVLSFILVVSTLAMAPVQRANAALSSYQTQMNTFSKEWMAYYQKMGAYGEKLLDIVIEAAEKEDASVMSKGYGLLNEVQSVSLAFEKKMKTKLATMHPQIQNIHNNMVPSMKLEIQEANHLFDYYNALVKHQVGEISLKELELELEIYDERLTLVEKQIDEMDKKVTKALQSYSKTYQVAYSVTLEDLYSDSLTVKPIVEYKVKRGNTLSSIARTYGMTVTQLKAINGLKTNGLRVGQVLKVHAYKNTSTFYIVQRGETIQAIAKKFGLTVNQLKNLNKLKSNSLKVGQKLNVDWKYTVKRGDTLSAIAKKYGKTVQQLKNINLLTTNGLKVGQVLRLN